MPERPRFSRFRRLPGLYRFGDAKPPDLDAEPQLLAIYLPAGVLDRAEKLAMMAGSETMQEYCTRLLHEAIEVEEEHARLEAEAARHGTLESLDELTSDPEYLSQWTAQTRGRDEEGQADLKFTPPSADDSARVQARAVVLRHAGIGEDDPEALLVKLRRGETLGAEDLVELSAALVELESSLAGHHAIDRRLAYALHKLAFEGQILTTEGMSLASTDPGTVDALRHVQEAVDRILSGEDIRYFADPSGPADHPGTSRP